MFGINIKITNTATIPKAHFTKAQQKKTNFSYFVITGSLSKNLFSDGVNERHVSNSKSSFWIIPIKLAYYIYNTREPAKAFKQPWIIIKLLDEKHV